ncbi:right-handed parallel beta-helix repeat-containing protein [Pedobacter insulae]|uniref:Right handed beta helix region n=1 Tax=Pedobacter insulae TaxID=414048 RepID=A0A1I2WRH5_9SPHI|nr:right-handed parallel beta-helix repeat-containing protein [Pedobacter insulae]SFH03934.1 Right handed beta helix region [Pedobacter insulae]
MKTKSFYKLLILLCLINFISFTSEADTYYVDSQKGNDNASGKSVKKAWKTLDKVNSQLFKAGDKVQFKRGSYWQGQLVPKGSGNQMASIIFCAYGKGNLPHIAANGKYQDAVLLKNISYITVQNLELSNHDTTIKEQKTGPTALRILAEDIGTLYNIKISDLYIHDVNGDNRKGSQEGHGIFWDCRGPKPSRIENLLIENCKLVRVDRNGIRGNGTFGFRNNWFPNKNLVIRNCTLEDIGGDGIVVKAFDGSLIEHNKLFHIRTRAKDNAVGIWPHSSDNTIIQYNEVAYTKNQDWSNDGQSFDIDGNCNNTIIQNNYSHDNEGGFMLVISDAINAKSMMTKNSIIRNNLSINDGNNRKRLFNFALITDSTLVSNNVFYNDTKDSVKIELIDVEHAIPKHIVFEKNIIQYYNGAQAIFTKSEEQYNAITWNENTFDGNILGKEKLKNLTEGKKLIKDKNLKEYPWVLLKQLNLK